MAALAALAPFALVGMMALVSIAMTLRIALPVIRTLRGELDACPQTREFSFRVVEVISGWDDGKVVALPVRPRLPRPAAPVRRAAA